MHNFQRDGMHQMRVPKGRINYSPNSQTPLDSRDNAKLGFVSAKVAEAGDKLRVRSATFADHFSQARQFFYSQNDTEQSHIVSAFTFELSKVAAKPIRDRMLGQLANVDSAIAQRVAKGLGHRGSIAAVPASVAARTNLKPSPTLSILKKTTPTLQGRVIGCLVADGTDAALLTSLRNAAKQSGAKLKIIAPTIEGAKGSDGQPIAADLHLAGGPSVLFDTVFLALSPDAGQQLSAQPAAVGFVQDAFSHLKVIGHTAGAQPLLTKAGVAGDEGVLAADSAAVAASFVAQAAKGRIWAREPKLRPAL